MILLWLSGFYKPPCIILCYTYIKLIYYSISIQVFGKISLHGMRSLIIELDKIEGIHQTILINIPSVNAKEPRNIFHIGTI